MARSYGWRLVDDGAVEKTRIGHRPDGRALRAIGLEPTRPDVTCPFPGSLVREAIASEDRETQDESGSARRRLGRQAVLWRWRICLRILDLSLVHALCLNVPTMQ